MLLTKIRLIWLSGFKREAFQKSTNQKQELPVVAMFVNGSRGNEQSLQSTSHRCFLPIFGSFGYVVSEEKIFQKSTNQKQELSVAAMFVNGLGRNESYLQKTFHRYFLLRFGSFGQEYFKKSANQKQESPVVAMFVNGSGRNEQSLHRCFLPSFVSFGQAVSEEKIFLNWPIRNKNCLWRPCLLMDRGIMCNYQKGPSIDASY